MYVSSTYKRIEAQKSRSDEKRGDLDRKFENFESLAQAMWHASLSPLSLAIFQTDVGNSPWKKISLETDVLLCFL